MALLTTPLRKCSHEAWLKRGILWHGGYKEGEVMLDPAKEGMVNVTDRKCSHKSSLKRLSYGSKDTERKAEFCMEHAKEGMVSVKDPKCVLRRRCRSNGEPVNDRRSN